MILGDEVEEKGSLLKQAVKTIMYTFFDPIKGLDIYSCNENKYGDSDEDEPAANGRSNPQSQQPS